MEATPPLRYAPGMSARSSSALRRRATVADWLAVPEEQGAELINGEIVYKAMPNARHGRLQRRIGALLDPYDRAPGEPDQPGGWWISLEVDLKLGQDGVRPDLCGWRRERVPTLPEPDAVERVITERPDWVCEILSTTTASRDLGEKLAIYYRAGVPHYWVVDPANETLTVYRRTGDGYLVAQVGGKTKVLRAEPFAAIELDLAALFDLPAP